MSKVLVDSIELTAGPYGCLLVHGLTGTPYEMQSLGQALYNDGFSVRIPRLPGHATDNWQDLASSTWMDWFKAVEDEYDSLAIHCQKVILIGLSIGGSLCMHFVSHRPHDAAALVMLATPRTILNPALQFLLRLTVKLFPVWTRRPKTSSSIRDPEARASHVTGQHISYAAVLSACDLLSNLEGNLHRINVPTLLVHSKLDPTANPSDANYIYAHIGSVEKRLIWLSRSYHVVTRDYDKDIVQNEIISLARRVRDNVHPIIAGED